MKHRGFVFGIGGGVLIIAVILGSMETVNLLNTVSTDDAYVDGHVTFVAARVPGQVIAVYVDDNNRVHKGDLLLQLDPQPYQDQVNIEQAAVDAAQANLTLAQADARALVGQARSLRFALDHAIEDVDNQVALLQAKVATLQSDQATLVRAQADYDRAAPLVSSGAVTREELDRRKQVLDSARDEVAEALAGVYEVRVELGLPPKPLEGHDLTEVPPDLDQTFSAVRQVQGQLMAAAAQLGYFAGFNNTPKQMIADFYKQDPSGDVDVIYAKLLKNAPTVKVAQTKLLQAQTDLDQAKLNLSYCNVYAEIDGQITRRDVNPGNNVIPGQSLMAIRSLTEIWVDANFKETQLGYLRIGQPVDLDVDMYGSHHKFKGRISGFEMGTGSTLALLPAENATGNFVKVVQRVPVRIDLVDYDPNVLPLFIGLSVEPTVHINETPTGPNAGKFLQMFEPTIPAGVPETQP
ncbi:MAG TPA: HlyD family secretion protein [Tepidisphaeraceae bacterium]|nr:HlyD family secretion protein [Tepidisphaeraceae bacterium]